MNACTTTPFTTSRRYAGKLNQQMQRLLVRVLQPYLSIDGEAKLTERPMSVSSASCCHQPVSSQSLATPGLGQTRKYACR
jgi:hypothetical protein